MDIFTWNVAEGTVPGPYHIEFVLTDGMLPVSRVVRIDVAIDENGTVLGVCGLMGSKL